MGVAKGGLTRRPGETIGELSERRPPKGRLSKGLQKTAGLLCTGASRKV